MRLLVLSLLMIWISFPAGALPLTSKNLEGPIYLNENSQLDFALTPISQDQPPALDVFKPLERSSFRCLDCVLWLKWDLEAALDLKVPQDLVLELSTFITSAQLFQIGESKPEAVTGRQFALKERAIPESTLLLPLTLSPGEKKTYLLRLSGRLPISTRLLLHSKVGWADTKVRRHSSAALFLGAISTILLINLLLFFVSDRRKERLYYFLFQFFLHVVFALNSMGYTILLWPDSVEWDVIIRYVALIVGLPSLALFTSEFLNLRSVAPRLNKWVLGWGVLVIAITPFAYLYPAWEQNVALVILTGGLILIFAVGAYLAWRGQEDARWFFAGIGFFAACAVLYVSLNNGLISTGRILSPSLVIQVGTFVEALILALAISMKIFNERVQRERAESAHATYLNEARNAAEAAGRAKSDFIRNMSHELRTPLNSLVGYSDFLLTSDCSESERREIISTIKRQAEHLTSIVGDVLDFASLERGSFSTSAAPFNLRELIDEVSDFFLPMISKKGMTIHVEVPPEIPLTFTADRFRLRQILMNVVGNACKFSEQGQVQIGVAIESTKPRPTLVIKVRDEGPGIPEDLQRLIFEPFYQIHSEVSRKHGGMGLGLSYARDMARALGGDLSLKRSRLGRGSEFEIRMPEAVSIYSPVRKNWSGSSVVGPYLTPKT